MSPFTVSPDMRRGLLRALFIAGLLALDACSTVGEPKPAPPPPRIELPGRHLVTIGEREAGATIVLDAAQELTVRLPLDDLAVTAGLDWLLTDIKPEVLSNGPSKFEVATRDGSSDGLRGDVVWRFTPQAAGSTALRFELRRTHSLDPPTRIATYVVKVK
jgi:hypothetical protein